MQSYNWNSFTLRIPTTAAPKSVYEAWTSQAGLESWFLREAEFTSAAGIQRSRSEPLAGGDKYKWLWHGYPDEVVEKHSLISVNGWDELQFGFSGNCIVTVKIYTENQFTLCELRQEMPMEDPAVKMYYYIECGRGWTFYLSNLKSVLEGGIDLRNRSMDLTGKVFS